MLESQTLLDQWNRKDYLKCTVLLYKSIFAYYLITVSLFVCMCVKIKLRWRQWDFYNHSPPWSHYNCPYTTPDNRLVFSVIIALKYFCSRFATWLVFDQSIWKTRRKSNSTLLAHSFTLKMPWYTRFLLPFSRRGSFRCCDSRVTWCYKTHTTCIKLPVYPEVRFKIFTCFSLFPCKQRLDFYSHQVSIVSLCSLLFVFNFCFSTTHYLTQDPARFGLLLSKFPRDSRATRRKTKP